MVIFAKKHFSGNNAKLFSFLINFAIYLRAFLALLIRFIKQIFLPVIDLIYVVTGLYALTNYWKMSDIDFPEELIQYSIPIYAATWLSVSYFNGGYDFPIKIYKLLKGVFLGTVLILIAYAILPKSLQFSRLFIFVGAAWVILYYLISRVFLHFAIRKKFNLKINNKKRFGIFGNDKEFERVSELLAHTTQDIQKVDQLKLNSKIDVELFDELIYSSKDYSFTQIIEGMRSYGCSHLEFKIAPEGTDYLVGSNSIDTAGELYILNLNALISKENKRKKRLFDFIFSFILIILSPFTIFLFKQKANYFNNLISVFIGKKSFIGFSEDVAKRDVRLPRIKPGILSPSDGIERIDEIIIDKLNLLYSRDYSMRKDFSILLKSWTKLDK